MQIKLPIFFPIDKSIKVRPLIHILLSGCCLFSCKKFVTIDPPVTQLVTASVFTSDATATSAMVGIYSQMVQSNGFASGNFAGVNNLSGLSGDELENYSVDPLLTEFFRNGIATSNSYLVGP